MHVQLSTRAHSRMRMPALKALKRVTNIALRKRCKFFMVKEADLYWWVNWGIIVVNSSLP